MTDRSKPRRSVGRSPVRAAAWFFENAQDLFGVLGAEGKIVSVNPAWERVTGWSPDELQARPMLDFVREDQRDDVVGMIRAVAEHGSVHALMHFATKDGGWVWLEGYGAAGPDGEIMGALRDVTEARRRAAELEHIRQVQSRLQEAAGIGLWRFDPQTQAIHWSPEWRALFEEAGLAVDTVEEFMATCHPDDVEAIVAAINRVEAGESTAVFAHRFQAADGRWVWVRANIWGEQGADGRLTIHGISQVTTELAEALEAVTAAQQAGEAHTERLKVALGAAKRQEVALIAAEQAAQMAAEAKSQFLANMSHEIRTPMNGVLGVLHLLKSHDLPEASRAMIAEALACGGMLEALLDDVVDFSKIEAGRLELAREAADPAAIVESVAKMLRPKAEDKGLSLHLDMGDLPAWVLTDPVRLR